MTVHNDSKSQTDLHLRWHGLQFVSRVQTLSLVEELPGLDANGDGQLSRAELELGADSIVQCLADGYRLGPGQRAPVQAQFQAAELCPVELDGFGMPRLREVLVTWNAQWPGDLRNHSRIELSNTLFLDSSPGHQDRLTYHFEGQAGRTGTWTAGGRGQELVGMVGPPPAGWQQVLSHAWQGGSGLALVLALACMARGLERRGLGYWDWLWLVIPVALLGWVMPGLGRPGPGGVLFLPVALLYVLADSRLGGRLLGSGFALALWGAAFAMGAWADPRGILLERDLPAGLVQFLAATLCFAVAALVARAGPRPYLFHAAWLGALGAGALWAARLWS